MGLFSKKNRVVDLTEKYYKDQEKIQELKENLSETKQEENNFGFFGNFQPMNQSPTSETEDSEERKKKLAKRLMELTDKLEEVSNKLYHMEQRLELIERKLNINGY